MGLPLRNPSLNLTPGPDAPGGSHIGSGSDTDLDPTSEPLGYSNHSSYRNTRIAKYPRATRSQRTERTRKSSQHLRAAHIQRVRAPAAETHHVKPRQPWAADADEGAALARSGLRLPGDNSDIYNCHGQDINVSRSNSSGSGSGSGRSRSRGSVSSDRRRPPSLERQDAFRDARTVKRRRGCSAVSTPSYSLSRDGEYVIRMEVEDDREDEAREIDELYRMGLLYDDEYERGEGFSMERIVREEPVYAVRTRPAKRGRQDERAASNVSLEVDLAFSAFGEDEVFAGWSGSGSRDGEWDVYAAAPPLRHDTPRLTVIYELVDNAAALAADGFLDSVSEVSYSVGEDDERAWAILDGCNGANEDAASASVVEVVADEDADPWVVLGHDGS